MNYLPLSQAEVGAIALTMFDLGMLHPVDGVPSLPQPPPGRESEGFEALLDMPTVTLDDDLRAYVDAHHTRMAWHPESPTGISAHKLANPGWFISAAEVRAALEVFDRTGGRDVRSAVERQFAAVDSERWDDWTKLLRGSAFSGYPILFGDPSYEGPWAIAELVLDQELRTP